MLSDVLHGDYTVPNMQGDSCPGQIDPQCFPENLFDGLHRHEDKFAPDIIRLPILIHNQDTVPTWEIPSSMD